MVSLKKLSLLLIVCFSFNSKARETILEFKGAYFLPTNSCFKDIYGNGSAMYGPELTVQLCEDKNWYAFASIDYFQKKGKSLGLCNFTKVKLIPLTFGMKYFLPTCRDRVSFYTGLALVAENVRTNNCSQFVEQDQSTWGIGGIVKVGTYCYLPHNFLIDMFIDYSFVKAGSGLCKYQDSFVVQPLKANVSGALFGVGLGYSF